MSCWFLEPKVYYVKLTMNMAHSPLTTWKCPNKTNCVHFKLSIILSVQTFQMSNVLLEKCANFLKLHHYWQHTDFEQPELEVLVHCPFSVFSYIAPVSPWNIFLLHDIQTLWTIYPKYVILHFTFIHTVMIPNAADSECLILLFIV